jgi:hypothetical protein
MTAMVFSDLSLGSRIVLSSCGELSSIGSTSVDATSPFSRSVASVMTGGAGNKERRNSEHGTRNLEPRGKRVNRLVELPADVQADKLRQTSKAPSTFQLTPA